MSAPLQLETLQQTITQLCDKVQQLTEANHVLQNELQGSENVRRLLVRKNKQLAEQVKQIINELKTSEIS